MVLFAELRDKNWRVPVNRYVNRNVQILQNIQNMIKSQCLFKKSMPSFGRLCESGGKVPLSLIKTQEQKSAKTSVSNLEKQFFKNVASKRSWHHQKPR